MRPGPWLLKTLYAPYRRVQAGGDVRTYLRTAASPRINIGSGRNLVPGWLNIDILPRPGAVWLDASKPWPFADGSFDAALCEHMIEHVPKPFGQHLLQETLRTLKPGGWLRVITPDLTWFAEKALGQGPAEDEDYLRFLRDFTGDPGVNWCDAVNILFREYGHQYIWSIEELSAGLKAAGFSELVIGRAAHPVQPVFDGVEGHPAMITRHSGADGVRIDALEAFAIEARKAP